MSIGHGIVSSVSLLFFFVFRFSHSCTFETNTSVQCVEVKNSMCQHYNWEGYNYTSFPNSFGHRDFASAENIVNKYGELVEANCSRYTAHLLCSAAYPLCFQRLQVLGPCRELCEEVRDNCASYIQASPRLQNLIRELQCSSLPRFGGAKACVWKTNDCSPNSAATTSVQNGGEEPPSTSASSLADCDGHLVPLGNYSKASFGGKKDCADPCRGIYFEDHHNQLIVICTAILSMLCFVSAVFVFVTFILNFRSVRKLEASIYYVALSYVGLGLTNIITVTVGKDSLICDSSAQNTFNESAVVTESRASPVCLAIFSATYYFTLCSWAWWSSATLQWFLFSLGVKAIRVTLNVGFHTVSWGVPLLFVLTALGTGEIAGDPIIQTCWISKNHRVPFVVAPLAGAILFCSTLVLIRFTCFLRPKYKKLRITEEEWQKPSKEGVPSRQLLFKINLYIVLTLAIMGILFCCYFYDYWYRSGWDRFYLWCSAESTIQTCQSLSNSKKPSLPVYLALVASSVAMGVLTIFWVLHKERLQAWKKTFKFLCVCHQKADRFTEAPTPENKPGISPISVKLEEESDTAAV